LRHQVHRDGKDQQTEDKIAITEERAACHTGNQSSFVNANNGNSVR